MKSYLKKRWKWIKRNFAILFDIGLVAVACALVGEYWVTTGFLLGVLHGYLLDRD